MSLGGGKDASKNRPPRESLAPIFRFHKTVRSVSAIRKDGTQLYSVMKEGLRRLEPEGLIPEVLIRFAIEKGLAEAEDKYYGGLKSIALNREKVKHIVYPKPDKILVVSTEPDFPMEKIDALGELVGMLKVD